MRVRVWTTPQADQQAIAATDWWRANRPASPDLFARELSGAVGLLADAPDIGRPYRDSSAPGLRRLLLPITRYHVYYVHDTENGAVVVLAIWSAVRGRGPVLAP